jgi:hypothetical protein
MRLLRKSNIKENPGPPSLIRTKRKPKNEARLPSGRRKMHRPEMDTSRPETWVYPD